MDFSLTSTQLELQRRALDAGSEFRDQAARWDADDDAPYRAIFDRMGELGFSALTMPSEHGGQGLTALDYFIAAEAIFRGSQSWLCCEPLFCTSGPGPSMLLLGDAAVQERYLPDIISGRRGCNIALTEPAYGSALTHSTTFRAPKGSAR
jgi:butyryl-CoA dehydrogenase